MENNKVIQEKDLERVNGGGFGELDSLDDKFFVGKTLVKFHDKYLDNGKGPNWINIGKINFILCYDNNRMGVEVNGYDRLFYIYPGDVEEYSNDGGNTWLK